MDNRAERKAISGIEEARVRAEVSENVRAVAHSMVLEDQAIDRIEERIEEEVQRILREDAAK
jgi:hypothetical protein